MIRSDFAAIHLQIASLMRHIHERAPGEIDAVLDEIATSAAELVPGAEYAGISIVTGHGGPETAAGTGHYPALLDRIQRHHGEGPCLEAARQHHALRVDDLAIDTRWAHYRREAMAQTPIRSVLSLPMTTQHRTLGALNIFAEQPQAFTTEAMDIAIIYATHAALAWNALRRSDKLHAALASRDIIGQAKGILMLRYHITADAAHSLLGRLSQRSGSSVADASRQLVEGDGCGTHSSLGSAGTNTGAKLASGDQLTTSQLPGHWETHCAEENRRRIRQATRC